MSERAEALAKKFEQANGEMMKTIEGMSDAQWRASCAGEGWPVGVTAHHAATSTAGISGLVQAIAAGQSPNLDISVVDTGNAAHATEFANVAKQETLDLARKNGEAAAAMLRGLSDGQLDSKGVGITQAGEMSAQQVVEGILIGHISGHSESMKAAK